MLDLFDRPLRDLRISVTDRCNLRCRYCMPRDVYGPGHEFLPRADLLSFEEIVRLTRVLAAQGVEKVRLTGGEPPLPTEPAGLKRIVRDGESDLLAVEEPLEIRVCGEPIAVTMRTPGHDEELAAGFLYGEGLLLQPPRIGLTEDLAVNTIEVRGSLAHDPGIRRFYTTSSCGVCGKGALEQVAVHADALPDGPRVARELLATLPDRLVQPGFARTGGLHATGLFDTAGELACVREDVGRHNAMDKVIGWALLTGRLPLHQAILCVGGRLSFELVQKAAVARAPLLVGVGAPTSLAVELAQDRGLTLGGFARRGKINVYSHPERTQPLTHQ
jgi:FdhD protein